MGVNLFYTAGDNIGSPNDGQNYGPYNVGSCSKIVHAILTMTFSFPGASLAPTATLTNTIMWGLQWGAAGYTPQNLPGDAYHYNFLFAEYSADNLGASVGWAPNTDGGAVLTAYTARREWRGQVPTNESSLDLYVSTGQTADPFPFVASFALRLWNIT